jgi:hypothetical protein
VQASYRSTAVAAAGIVLAAAAGGWLLQPKATQGPPALPRASVPDVPAAPAMTNVPDMPQDGSPVVAPVGPAQAEARTAPPAMTKREAVKDLADRVKHARESQPPPAPEIAQARTFQDAFAAMKLAQQREQAPAASEAGVNPFGASPSR